MNENNFLFQACESSVKVKCAVNVIKLSNYIDDKNRRQAEDRLRDVDDFGVQ